MGCNCKNNNIDTLLKNTTQSEESIGARIAKYFFKTLVFVLVLAALPIIMLFIIWFLFKTIVLNKEVTIKPLLTTIGKKFQDNEEEYEEEVDFDTLTEKDVVMVDVEDITNKRN